MELSPQARRRLDACLHGSEWTDLVHDIAEAIEAHTRRGFNPRVAGEEERAVILSALKGEG